MIIFFCKNCHDEIIIFPCKFYCFIIYFLQRNMEKLFSEIYCINAFIVKCFV